MPSRLDDEKYSRKRAEQMRALPPQCQTRQSILMTDLAEEYEKLADKPR